MACRQPDAVEEYTYTVVFEPEEEGGYTVTCPALPGLVTYGDTPEEARAMAADAIACYLESLRKDGLSVPLDDGVKAGPIREVVTVRPGGTLTFAERTARWREPMVGRETTDSAEL